MIPPSLHRGVVIPANPLALTAQRKLDERRQRALCRYYIAAGAGGLAVAVHTTQFQIRDPKIGLFQPVLALAAEEISRADATRPESLVRIGGICGQTPQADAEAATLRDLGYHAGLLSLAAMKDATEPQLIEHCWNVADTIPLIGFYLQPAVGGRVLSYDFWRSFLDIQNIAAIKIAPFNRYRTLDVLRAHADSGRDDVALYTGNDDNIILDLITPHEFIVNNQPVTRRFAGGLLGHWSVHTQCAVQQLKLCKSTTHQNPSPTTPLSQANHPDRSEKLLSPSPSNLGEGRGEGSPLAPLLRLAIQVTDTNAAYFDAANNFAGCIAGLHEVLRRQGLLEGIWCLDENETLSPGQDKEITRVLQDYPHLHDNDFIEEHRDQWLK